MPSLIKKNTFLEIFIEEDVIFKVHLPYPPSFILEVTLPLRGNDRIEADLKKKEKEEADLRRMIKELQNQK